jgi:hypothetical protein
MTPYSGYLYSAFSGYDNPDVEIVLPDTAYLVILLWRVFLFLMKLDLREFARPLEDFRPPRSADILLEVDGSPIGIGFFIHQRVNGRWKCFYAVSWCHEYDLRNDSRYQNSMEFIAPIMGLACLAYLGLRHKRVEILGDNTTSLVWLEALRFRPGASTAAAIAYITLIKHCGFKVVSTVHQKGTENRADPFSRGVSTASHGFTAENSMTKHSAPPLIKEMSALLNPSVDIMEESALLEQMKKLDTISYHLSFN